MIPKKLLLVGLVYLLVLLPGVVVGAYHLVYRDKVYPRVRIAGVEVSNKTEIEAESRLKRKLLEWEGKVKVKIKDKEWEITEAQLELIYLPHVSAREAVEMGRKQGLWRDTKTKWKLWFRGEDLEIRSNYDKDKLATQAAEIAAVVDIPIIMPKVELANDSVTVSEGKKGEKINQEELKQRIVNNFLNLNTGEILIAPEEVNPEVTQEEMEQTRIRAEGLKNKSLVVSSGERNWTVKGNELFDWLNFKGGWDEEKIKLYLQDLAKKINRPAQNAAFQFVEGRVTEFKPAKEGLELQEEQSLKALMTQLEDTEKGEQKEQRVELVIGKTAPEISLDQVNNLGIKELIGRGYSTYRGSIASRIFNIGLASSRINGALIKPGETFSFNAAVGEITGATGYQQAYVIKEGATVLDDGGGVCQVSTTVFRAALNAGLPIVERHAHSYRVGYYEQNAKAGLDATVYAPSVDLQFTNNTPGHILIQAMASLGNASLTVEIYGTSDGRKATISNHQVTDITPPPPALYIDDPSISTGQVKQIDWAASGAKARFDYTVQRGGEIIFKKTFWSLFQPWQAKYMRGI